MLLSILYAFVSDDRMGGEGGGGGFSGSFGVCRNAEQRTPASFHLAVKVLHNVNQIPSTRELLTTHLLLTTSVLAPSNSSSVPLTFSPPLDSPLTPPPLHPKLRMPHLPYHLASLLTSTSAKITH